MKKPKALTLSKIFGFLILISSFNFANIQYSGQSHPFTQPDGLKVEARLYGDVAAMYAESPDGYSLVRGKDGYIYYAELSEDGSELLPTKYIYFGHPKAPFEGTPHLRRLPDVDKASMEKFHAVNSQYYTPRQKPLARQSAGNGDPEDINHYRSFEGTIRGIVLLVDFSDEPARHSVQDIDDFLNLKGYDKFGNNGSVRDLYTYASNGKLDFQHDLSPGYFRAPRPKSYYDNGSYSVTSELLKDVMDHFDNEIDFSQYDNDGDGVVEDLSVIYAGRGGTFGQGIWPHSGGYRDRRDGVEFSRYQITDSNPDALGIYVMAHETGHLIFGWPDAYGTGDQGLMGSRPSDRNPCPPSDVYRADQGWMTIIDVDPSTHAYFMDASNNEVVYRWRNRDKPGEWFLWSNRDNSGRYSVLRGRGLQMYHFDFDIRRNSPPQTLSLAVVQADGRDELGATNWPTPGSDPEDFFHSGTSDVFDDNSSPSARWNNGSPSGLILHEISAPGDTMTFAVGENPVGMESPKPLQNAKWDARFQNGFLVIESPTEGNLAYSITQVNGRQAILSGELKARAGVNRIAARELGPGVCLVHVSFKGQAVGKGSSFTKRMLLWQ